MVATSNPVEPLLLTAEQAAECLALFPELRVHLEAVFEQAKEGAAQVITRYRDPAVNLRTRLERIIRKAGLNSWPKPFQNLRATRDRRSIPAGSRNDAQSNLQRPSGAIERSLGTT